MSVEGGRHLNPNLVRNVSCSLLRLLSKGITLNGEENIPGSGPAIIVANHMGNLESLAFYAYLPETPVVFSKKENLKIPLFGSLLRMLGAVPVDRGKASHQAFKAINSVLVKRKGIIFTFPEGTRGRDSDGNRTILKPAKEGVILIAQQAANRLQMPIPISPWAIWGTEGVFPEIDEPGPIRQRFMFHPDHVFINVGAPYYVYPSDKKLVKKDMQDQIDSIMLQIRDMLPVQYHGYYAG